MVSPVWVPPLFLGPSLISPSLIPQRGSEGEGLLKLIKGGLIESNQASVGLFSFKHSLLAPEMWRGQPLLSSQTYTAGGLHIEVSISPKRAESLWTISSSRLETHSRNCFFPASGSSPGQPSGSRRLWVARKIKEISNFSSPSLFHSRIDSSWVSR